MARMVWNLGVSLWGPKMKMTAKKIAFRKVETSWNETNLGQHNLDQNRGSWWTELPYHPVQPRLQEAFLPLGRTVVDQDAVGHQDEVEDNLCHDVHWKQRNEKSCEQNLLFLQTAIICDWARFSYDGQSSQGGRGSRECWCRRRVQKRSKRRRRRPVFLVGSKGTPSWVAEELGIVKSVTITELVWCGQEGFANRRPERFPGMKNGIGLRQILEKIKLASKKKRKLIH